MLVDRNRSHPGIADVLGESRYYRIWPSVQIGGVTNRLNALMVLGSYPSFYTRQRSPKTTYIRPGGGKPIQRIKKNRCCIDERGRVVS
jgi:hypothetical protein